MAKQYKALKPIGPWRVGDLVGDLSQDKIDQLLGDGVIEVIKPEAKIKAKEVANNG